MYHFSSFWLLSGAFSAPEIRVFSAVPAISLLRTVGRRNIQRKLGYNRSHLGRSSGEEPRPRGNTNAKRHRAVPGIPTLAQASGSEQYLHPARRTQSVSERRTASPVEPPPRWLARCLDIAACVPMPANLATTLTHKTTPRESFPCNSIVRSTRLNAY